MATWLAESFSQTRENNMGKITALHPKPHPLRGEKVVFRALAGMQDGSLRDGEPVTILDWHDRQNKGRGWRETFGDDYRSPATGYNRRRSRKPTGLPRDEEVVVVYTSTGEIRAIHQKEIGEVYGQEKDESAEPGRTK